jgi:hypothetical protein
MEGGFEGGDQGCEGCGRVDGLRGGRGNEVEPVDIR